MHPRKSCQMVKGRPALSRRAERKNSRRTGSLLAPAARPAPPVKATGFRPTNAPISDKTDTVFPILTVSRPRCPGPGVKSCTHRHSVRESRRATAEHRRRTRSTVTSVRVSHESPPATGSKQSDTVGNRRPTCSKRAHTPRTCASTLCNKNCTQLEPCGLFSYHFCTN